MSQITATKNGQTRSFGAAQWKTLTGSLDAPSWNGWIRTDIETDETMQPVKRPFFPPELRSNLPKAEQEAVAELDAAINSKGTDAGKKPKRNGTRNKK